jgi:predicted DNA-binding transcriptional regulator YafY
MQASHCLLAYCHLHANYRAFRLDRMRNPTLTGASFRPNRVALLRDCLAKMRAQEPS